MSLTEEIIEIRKIVCAECTCAVDKEDPFSSCPASRWGPFESLPLPPLPPLPSPPFHRFPAPPDTTQLGPALWADLHATAEAGQLTSAWLEAFASRIPCGACRAHWQTLLNEIPPRYDDQWAWSVETHNAVNRRLGKPEWSRALQMVQGVSPSRSSTKLSTQFR